ncbi:MAG: ester cyclase [Betaproteobacteria bacterium]
MTTTDTNKGIVVDFITDLFTRGDLTAVDRFLDPAFVNHDPPFPGAPAGPEGMRHAAAMFRAALPDWHSDVIQAIAEDDLVVENFVARGTHRGPLMGAAPTNREIALAGINIFRLKDGLIVERWGRLDQLGLMQQLGLAP